MTPEQKRALASEIDAYEADLHAYMEVREQTQWIGQFARLEELRAHYERLHDDLIDAAVAWGHKRGRQSILPAIVLAAAGDEKGEHIRERCQVVIDQLRAEREAHHD